MQVLIFAYDLDQTLKLEGILLDGGRRLDRIREHVPPQLWAIIGLGENNCAYLTIACAAPDQFYA